MESTLNFSETERTPQQRRETVKWAVGVAMSQGGNPSPELVALYNRYIAGEVTLSTIRAEVERLYPQQPSTDPYPPYQPDLNGAPSPPYKPIPVNQELELA